MSNLVLETVNKLLSLELHTELKKNKFAKAIKNFGKLAKL